MFRPLLQIVVSHHMYNAVKTLILLNWFYCHGAVISIHCLFTANFTFVFMNIYIISIHDICYNSAGPH